jgi:hypothetical protein
LAIIKGLRAECKWTFIARKMANLSVGSLITLHENNSLGSLSGQLMVAGT